MPITEAQRTALATVDTTSLCDADKSLRVMDPRIAPRSAVARMAGTAYTVACDGDFFGALRALTLAGSGDVLVVSGSGRRVAYAGELFAREALARGLAGIVVDGGYRDIAWVRTCPLPVWSRYVTPMAGTTAEPGRLQVEVGCGGVPVRPGDVVVADENGVVVLDPSEVDALVARARGVVETESRVLAALDAGASLGGCLNVAEHAAALAAGEESRLRFLV